MTDPLAYISEWTPPRGYYPQNGQMSFKCGRCGCRTFKSYPQTAPADRSKGWTYEYECANCGQIMGLTIKGRNEE